MAYTIAKHIYHFSAILCDLALMFRGNYVA